LKAAAGPIISPPASASGWAIEFSKGSDMVKAGTGGQSRGREELSDEFY
jgi:hypothetical protein